MGEPVRVTNTDRTGGEPPWVRVSSSSALTLAGALLPGPPSRVTITGRERTSIIASARSIEQPLQDLFYRHCEYQAIHVLVRLRQLERLEHELGPVM